MKTDSPYFSIIVPTYNRAHLLGSTLLSLINLSYNNYEILVIDDGSTDNTQEVVDQINSPILFYHKKPNGERGAARNYGAHLASGEYVNFFDSDDIAYQNHLTLASRFLYSNPRVEVFHLSFDIKLPNGVLKERRILSGNRSPHLLNGNEFSCNGIFIRKDITLANPFSENRALSATEDYDLWLKLGARFKIQSVPEVSHAVIEHDERSVNLFNLKSIDNRAKLLRESIDADVECKIFYGNDIANKVYAHMLSYIAIHAAVEGHRKTAVNYLIKSLRYSKAELLSRRTLAIIKHLIIS